MGEGGAFRGLFAGGGLGAPHDVGKALQHLAGVGVDLIFEVPQGGVVELYLIVGGGLVQLGVRFAGDGIHGQGPGVFLGGLGGGGGGEGQLRDHVLFITHSSFLQLSTTITQNYSQRQ